jgi:uncharacterized protein (DUF1778 family)
VNPPSSTPPPDPEGRDLTTAVTSPGLDASSAAPGRHRHHRFPARPHALKVLYGDDEHATIRRAAQIAGLRPSSYVAAAALAVAEQVVSVEASTAAEPVDIPGRRLRTTLTPHQDRELLAELIQSRSALRRDAVNVNQVAAVLNSGGTAPVWLEQAVAGANRALAAVDAAAQKLFRRLP